MKGRRTDAHSGNRQQLQLELLPAWSRVICITMGWPFKLLRNKMGWLICEGAGGIFLYECAKNSRESFWGLVALCSDSHESSSWYQVS